MRQKIFIPLLACFILLPLGAGAAEFEDDRLILPGSGGDDLLAVYQLAEDNDPRIRQSRAQYKASHTQVAESRANLLPSITLDASTSRNTAAPTRVYSYSDGFNRHGYSLSLGQNLLNLQALHSYRSAREGDRRAAMDLAIAEQDLIMRVATAYFDVLRSRANMTSFDAEVEAARRVFEQTEQRFDVGLEPVTALYESQTSLELAEVSRLEEEFRLQQRLEDLAAITGSPHEMLETLSEDFPIVPAQPADLNSWVDLAEENNLSVLSAEHDVESRREEARAAKAAAYPTLRITANYADNAETSNPFVAFISEASNSTGLALQFSMPLLNGGANQARKRRAYYNLDAGREALLLAQRDSVRAARNSFRGIETSVRAVRAREQAVISAQSTLEATEVGVEVGTRNVVDLVQAQRTLFQAQRDYANARLDYAIRTLELKQSIGSLSPNDVRELNEWLD